MRSPGRFRWCSGNDGPMTVHIAPHHAVERRYGKTGPWHPRAAALLRKVAEHETGDIPVLTAYLDLRPPVDQADPAVRATRVVVRDRLHEIDRSLPRHGDLHDSFSSDAARIEAMVEAESGEHERGMAVFACQAAGLFETLRTWAPFEPRVEFAARPELVAFARFIDHEPALLALADTNSLRLFVSQPGRLVELPSIDDEPDDYSQKETGDPAESRFERHVDDHRDRFARRAAKVITRAFEREAIERVFLAGDEVAIPHLRDALDTKVADRVRDVLRFERRATLDEIEATALPAIESAEVGDARDAADRLIGAIGARGLGVGGIDPTRQALEAGAGLELLLDARIAGEAFEPAAQPAVDLISEAEANELVALAARTGARITFVPAHDGLRELGGVGALLRYRP